MDCQYHGRVGFVHKLCQTTLSYSTAGSVVAERPAHNAYLTFSCASQLPAMGGIIKLIQVVEIGTSNVVDWELYLFRAEPTSQTINDTLNLTSDDINALISNKLTIANKLSGGNYTYAEASLDVPFQAGTNTNYLFGVLVPTSDINYTTATKIYVKLLIQQD